MCRCFTHSQSFTFFNNITLRLKKYDALFATRLFLSFLFVLHTQLQSGGAMVKTNDPKNRWAHILCSLCLPELKYKAGDEKVDLSRLNPQRESLVFHSVFLFYTHA